MIVLSEDCLKQDDDLPPLIFSFTLEYATRGVHANRESLILNGTHQLVVNAGDVNVMGGRVYTLYKEKKNRSFSSP